MAMQNSQSKGQMFLGFVLIVLMLLLGYWVVASIWRALSATPAVGAAIAAATLGGLATIAGHFTVKHLERKAAVVAQLREKKIPVYEDIIRLMFGIAFGGKGGRKKLNEQEMIRVWLFFVDGPGGFCKRHGKSYLTRRRRGGEGGGGGSLTGGAVRAAYRWA